MATPAMAAPALPALPAAPVPVAVPPVPPEPIRRGGFQYDGTFATIDGVAFERPQHLLRLCYPSEPDKWKIKLGRGRPPKMEKITDLEAARTLSRKFMLAQFRFYGLPPPYQSSSDEVLAIFRDQVSAGNFRKMAPDVEALRDEMAAEWETRKDSSAQRPRGRPKGSTRKNDDALPATIVGAYVITSKEIQDQWSVNGNLTLDVAPTSTPGVYKATFHFGVVLGVMILSADEKQLINHVRRLDAGDDPDRRTTTTTAATTTTTAGGGGGTGTGTGTGGGDDLAVATGGKRKQPPNGAGRRGDLQQQQQQQQHLVSAKKARGADGPHPVGAGGLPPGLSGMPGLGGLGALSGGGMGGMGGVGGVGSDGASVVTTATTATTATAATTAATTATTTSLPVSFPTSGRPPLKFYVRWRGRGLVENNMQTGEHRGTIKFTNKHYTKFAGEMDLAFLGADEITGKRVSDVPTLSGESWSDYLETVYDWTRGNRWN